MSPGGTNWEYDAGSMSQAEVELEKLTWMISLRARIDERLERSLVDHEGVEDTVRALLRMFTSELGLLGSFVHTFAEDLELHTWVTGSGEPDATTQTWLAERGGDARIQHDVAGGQLFAERLDVAGKWFGAVGFVTPIGADSARLTLALHTVCEILDNYLYAIAAAQRKHRTMMKLGDALRHPQLDKGLQLAVDVLAAEIPLARLLLVFHAEEDQHDSLHVQFYEGSQIRIDTLDVDQPDVRDMAAKMLLRDGARNRELVEHLGFDRPIAGPGMSVPPSVAYPVEEVLINGITESVIVGTLLALPSRRHFNTFDRDLLNGFAGFVRQRIVDFNKEWRSLATIFRDQDVAKLVRQNGYRQRYLMPREETCAILFADIAGFTRISERILRTPSRVARLVEVWSKLAVDIVWKNGGTFDKMVGDCIIALYGPPFYESTQQERLAAAIETAVALRTMTERLPELEEFVELREAGLGVSTGVNLAPVCVGLFGPDGDFTGFSSGMNNTARLQGCARGGEILVMEEACVVLGPEYSRYAFGPQQESAVKNVSDPLRFRAVDPRL